MARRSGFDHTCGVGPRLIKAAWLSVLAGLAMQLLTLAAALSAGGQPSLVSAVLGALSKLSWSTIVCLGVVVGLSVPRARYAGAALWGFSGAQLGFHGARALQHALGFALGQSANAQPATLLIGGSVIKGLQYAALALALLWLKRSADTGARNYALIGLGHGLVFGSALLTLHVRVTQQSAPALLIPMIVNEAVFPVLCALVVYATTRAQSAATKHLASARPADGAAGL
jgi:hypothetical protein